MEEQLVNEVGGCYFTADLSHPYYKVEYIRDEDKDSSSFSLYKSYGLKRLVEDFLSHTQYLAKFGYMVSYKIVDVWEYYQKPVDYRKTYGITYDWYRKSVYKEFKTYLATAIPTPLPEM